MRLLLCVFFILVFSSQLTAQSKASATGEEQSRFNGGEPETAERDEEIVDKKEKKEPEISEKQRKNDEKGADYVKKTLKFGTHKDRALAVRNVRNIKSPDIRKEVVLVLVENIKSETDASVLIKTFQLAADENAKEAITPISEKLSHKNDDVKIAAVYALKELDAKETQAKLVEALKAQDFTKDSSYVEGLLVTLGAFEEKGLFEFAKEKIEDSDTTRFHRLKLILFLGESKTIEAVPYLQEKFLDEDEDITLRSYSISSLAKIGDNSSIPHIKETITKIEGYPFKKKKKFNTLYMYSITALVKLGDAEAYTRLEESMKSNNAQVRLRSIKLMADLKDKRSIDILKYKANYDPNNKVRLAAKKALKDSFEIDLDAEKEEKKNSVKDEPETDKPSEE